jgi:hypothetical protein
MLAHARFLERGDDLANALSLYRDASNTALATQPPQFAEIAAIGYLRACARLVRTLPPVRSDLPELWRVTDGKLHASEEFRKQHFVYLVVSGQHEPADQIRSEFLAYRSAS